VLTIAQNERQWYIPFSVEKRGSRSLSPKDEQLGVRESERFRVHLELLLPLAKGRCWRGHKDDEHPKSV
jgi:hypothetical protein